MNKRSLLLILSVLVLVSLLAAPALAATTACPDSCSCLLPDEAKKAGYSAYCGGKQSVCGSDAQKNEKYCYTKAAAAVTTTTAPQLVVTGIKPVTTTVTVTKTMVTTTPTTPPLVAGPTRLMPVTCPSACACMPEEKAALAAVPLSLCGGTRSYCGSTADGTAMYCYTVPETVVPTTTTPALRTRTEPCSAGCTCLSTDKADAAGLKRCLRSTTLPCDYDPAGRPMQCYAITTTATTKPAATINPAGTTLIPVRLDITTGPTAPAPAPDAFSSFGTFVATLFGGREAVGAGSGSSRIIVCPFGLTDCDGACIDLRSDPRNCGRCRNLCPTEGSICCDGVCSQERSAENCGGCGNACSPDEPCFRLEGGDWFCSPSGCWNNNRSMDCGTGVCANLLEDRDNCGTCGNACTAGSVCDEGACTACPAGKIQCGIGNHCEEPLTDAYNCGGCGNVCDPDKVCVDGRCVTCPPGLNRCGSQCRDLQTAMYNCGACDASCTQGETCCGGHCRNLLNNASDCGSCGNACGESQGCIGGMCALMPTGPGVVTCRIGQTACSGSCTDLESDESNCGMCGRACPSGRVCIEGACLMAGGADGCGLGQVRCDGRCVDPATNWNNCGRCGHQCPAYYFCRESTCTPFYSGEDTVCDEPGLDYCSGDCADLRTSEVHCGRCGDDCTGGSCIDGTCYYLNSDRANCGSVGNRCAAGEVCCSGTCRSENTGDPDRCACSSVPCRASDGYGCCSGYCWALNTDTANCGACGHECTGEERCCGGRCTTMRWDENNCGRCGNACAWGKECQNGRCCLWGTTWGCD